MKQDLLHIARVQRLCDKACQTAIDSGTKTVRRSSPRTSLPQYCLDEVSCYTGTSGMTPGGSWCYTGVPGVTPGALSDSAPLLGFHYHPCCDSSHLLHLTVPLHPVDDLPLQADFMHPRQ